MGAFSTHQSNMAAKIVALVVVALALANAAPRDMSKLDNQVLEDKINEILSSSELMQSAQTEESPDWMVAARRSSNATITTVVTYTLSSVSGFTAARANTAGSAEYGTLAGAYVNIVANGCGYTGTASVVSTCPSYFSSFTQSATASRRATVAATYSAAGGSITASAVDTAMSNAGSSGITSAFNSAASSAGATGVTCTGASAASSSTAATSGVAQLTFGFAALLAALFAHLF